MAGLANVFIVCGLEELCMTEQHIFRVLQVMTDAIVAETLAVTCIAILQLSWRHLPMFDGPGEICVAFWSRPNNDGRFNQQPAAAGDDGNSVAKIAFRTDQADLITLFIQSHMVIIMTPEAP